MENLLPGMSIEVREDNILSCDSNSRSDPVDLTESFGFGLKSKSVAGFDVKSKPNPKIDSYSGLDRIQKSNARTRIFLKRAAQALCANQQLLKR